MIAVTGASGFIGRWLVRHLASSGRETRVLLRPGTGGAAASPASHVVTGDLRDRTVLPPFLEGCTCLVHLAGLYQHRAATLEEMFAVNLEAAKELFREALRQGVRRIVYISTAGVHAPTGERITEDTPFKEKTSDPYEQQKIACERFLFDLGREGSLESVVLRPATVYGPEDPRLMPLLQMIRSRRFFFIGSGENWVSWVYVRDVVSAIEAAIDHPAAAGKAFLVAGTEDVTLRRITSLIAADLGVPAPSMSLPVFPFRMAALFFESVFPLLGLRPPIYRARLRFFTDSLRYSSEKIRRDLGVILATGIEDGLARTVQAFREERSLEA